MIFTLFIVECLFDASEVLVMFNYYQVTLKFIRNWYSYFFWACIYTCLISAGKMLKFYG